MQNHKKLCNLIIVWLENNGVNVGVEQSDQYVQSVGIKMPDGRRRTIICYRNRTIVNSSVGPTCVSAITDTDPNDTDANVVRLNPEDPDFFDRIAKHLRLLI